MSTTKPFRARRGLKSGINRSGLENENTQTQDKERKEKRNQKETWPRAEPKDRPNCDMI